MCYALMAHVTDYDVWHISEEPVSVEMVVQILNRNTQAAQESIRVLARTIGSSERNCTCDSALASALITQPDKIPPETRQRLDLLTHKYLP